jgi:hypothetical protein
LVKPQNTGSATAVFERVQAQYNGASAYGISIDATATTGTITATATDSVSSNNGGGFLVEGPSPSAATLMLVRSVAAHNHTGVQADFGSNGGTVLMTQVAVIGNVIGWQGDAVFSYGDNTIGANGINNQAPPSATKE